jgi:plastocyanin
MPTRDIYLKIEQIPDYSPVEPEMMVGPPRHYRRDCMRNAGHEDANIPAAEVEARRLTALVYREYLDAGYLIPKPDKLILADINEPMYHRRTPGTVIYALPGDRLRIHVLNADVNSHSFHLHGLRYGIDSDGSWPFGTQSSDGRRSDEICPGQSWTYRYEVTTEMVGAWPFHDHHRQIGMFVNRGLFGGLVVLPRTGVRPPPDLKLPPVVGRLLKEREKPMRPRPPDPGPMVIGRAAAPAMTAMKMPAGGMGEMGGGIAGMGGGMGGGSGDFEAQSVVAFMEEWLMRSDVHPPVRDNDVLHVPVFFHQMSGSATPAFNSGPLPPGAPVFEVTFGAEGVFTYHCEIHTAMQGKVTVVMGGPSDAYVTIKPGQVFYPADVPVRPGGKVHWTQTSNETHTVTDDGGGMISYCLNGRTFVGNTPTIVAHPGQRILWYIFNLDLGMMWHNFHPHAQRWNFADQPVDVRSIGPAESFVVETRAPEVLLLPDSIKKAQDPKHRPRGAKPYHIKGDFPFHCHVEMHMMAGLVGLVRSRQTVWLTPKQADELAATTGLPVDDGTNDCQAVDYDRCNARDCGQWETVAGVPQVTTMHAALLPKSQKLLYWGHGDLGGPVPNQSRIWDYSTPAGVYSMPPNQPHDVSVNPADRYSWDIWSAEHAFLDDAAGTLLVHGGFSYRHGFSFDPGTLSWSPRASTAQDRFYASTLTLQDGKALTLFGNGPIDPLARSIEVYNPGTNSWSAPKSLPTGPPNAPPGSFDYQFYPWTYLLPGGDLFIAGHQGVTVRFNPNANPIVVNPSNVWMTIAGDRSTVSEKGTSVLLPLRPPSYHPRVLIAGGDPMAARKTAEIIDLSAAAPAWAALPNLNVERTVQVNSVLLPDGRVLVVGGVDSGPNGGPAEIFDPSHPADGWKMCGPMQTKRGYHSIAILLLDGSVVVGGDPPGTWGAGGGIANERYYPWYCFRARPVITGAPTAVHYGANFTIDCPSAASIAEVVLLRPGAVTHGFNMSQRFVGCAITGGGATTVQAHTPPDGTVAPPGWYLLFVVDGGRVPSVARWIRLTP